MNTDFIKVDTVTKYYKSSIALLNVSFTLEKGHIYGLLGPNGAGKSTLCSILSTATPPDTGEVIFFSQTFSREHSQSINNIRRNIGYLPQNPPIYPEMTAQEYLLFSGNSKGLSGDTLYNAVNSLFEMSELSLYADRPISTLSQGNARRVAILASIIAKPEFLILDEPSASLDPEQNLLLREIILNRKSSHNITLISSHNLYEIQNLCDRIIMLSNGQIVKTGDIGKLANDNPLQIKITLSSASSRITAAIEKLPDVISCKILGNTVFITAKANCNLTRISETIALNKGIIIGFTTAEPSLEDVYLKLISK